MYGLIKAGFGNLLFLEATARNDWSSALAAPLSNAHTSFFYPSFSAGFIASNWMKMPRAVDFLKLRASWAQVGNDTNPYQTAGVFQSSTPYNGQPTFSEQATIANTNLLSEKTSAIELGGEIRLFNHAVTLDLSYYNALTENQIISLPVSISSGYSQRVVNGGQVRSKGLEIIAAVSPIRSDEVIWRAQSNFSQNITRVESLPDEVDRLTLAYSRIYDNVNQTVFFSGSRRRQNRRYVWHGVFKKRRRCIYRRQ